MMIDVANAHPRYRRRRKVIQEIIRRVLWKERRHHADLGIVFIDDRRMRILNATYLKHDFPTDVLSFPLSSPRARLLEGEIYVNLDQARRQAKEFSVTFRGEIYRLVIHGTLHLLGYDDHTPSTRHRMTRKEDLYLKGYD